MAEQELSALDALLGADIDIEEDVYIDRLNVDFRIKAITGDKLKELQEQCTYTKKVGKERKKFIDEDELGALMIAESCIAPDFGDERLMKKHNAIDPGDCARKALLAGEIAKISSKILDISGFVDPDDEVEQAKN